MRRDAPASDRPAIVLTALAAFLAVSGGLDATQRGKAAPQTAARAGSVSLGQRVMARPPAGRPSDAVVRFVDVTAQAGITFQHVNGSSTDKHLVETMGSGGLFFDFDNDGWLDIFLVDGGSVANPAEAGRARHRLFRNRADGTFADVTATSGITHAGYGLGACAGDYDNDGLMDLYLTGLDAARLYRNTGGGAFRDVTETAHVGSRALGTSCAFADFDSDGYLDLFVAHYVDPAGNSTVCGNGRARAYCRPDVYRGEPDRLYANNRNGTFTELATRAGMNGAEGKGLGVVVGDYDDDGRPDVFVANDLTPNFLYHNEGAWRFREVGLLSGVAVASDGTIRAGMGTDFGDVDGDGRLDLVVTNFELETHNLFRNAGQGLFADATARSGLGMATLRYLGFGATFFDVDNDADLDVAIANGHVLDNTSLFRSSSRHAQPNLLLRNDGTGRFSSIGAASGAGFALEKVSRTVVAGDIDNDGDLDLLVTNNGQTADLLRNDGDNGHAFLLKLTGTASNRDGIGARVRVTARDTTQVREVKAGSSYLGQNDVRVHVGIGRSTQAARVEVRWPGGHIDVLSGVPAGQIVAVSEGKGVTGRTPLVLR